MHGEDREKLDERYIDIIDFLRRKSFRKKELVVLIAEKSGLGERTVYNYLDYLEDREVINEIRINKKRVFIELNDDYENAFDLELEGQQYSQIRSVLEEINQLIVHVTESTFPVRTNSHSSDSNVLSTFLSSIKKYLQNNTLPPKEMKKIEDNIKELHNHSDENFVILYREEQLRPIFNILDSLVFLLENHHRIDNAAEDNDELLTMTTDLAEASTIYLQFINRLSLNASLVGYGERYEEQLSARISKLNSLIRDGPDFVNDDLYYLIHSHGNLSQRIDAFIHKFINEDNVNYEEVRDSVLESYHTKKGRKQLQKRLSAVADDMDGQHRTIIELVCADLESYDKEIQIDSRIRYYNRTKEKIIAILSHGSSKLEDIELLSGESNNNISSNMNSLAKDGYVCSIEDRHGYYKLNDDVEKSFNKKRHKTPTAETEKVTQILEEMKEWREKKVYRDGVFIPDEEKLLERSQDPPWLNLLDLVLNTSFILEGTDQINLFLDILDSDIQHINSNITEYRTPEEIMTTLTISESIHNNWYRGLENINYHSELYNRLEEIKMAHDNVPLSDKKYIRSLIAVIDFEVADKLFKNAVRDGQEPVSHLEDSIDEIYYNNNEMNKIVDFLRDKNDRQPHCQSVRKELLEYCINIPYKNSF